uniref:Restriction endonuclease n=1 Tax=Desulfovibrio sp. U5L TaxID=596152 RepID=I2Q2N0_9BACT
MSLSSVPQHLKEWLVALFVKAINGVSKEEDRQDILDWLAQSRDVVGSEKSKKDKFLALYRLLDTRKTAKIALDGVVEAVKNYKQSNLPLAAKVALPVTLLATPILAGHGVGVAALGGAVGLPALLLLFLGTAGISAIIDSCLKSNEARAYLGEIAAFIVQDEVLRRASAAMQKAMRDQSMEASRFEMPEEEAMLRKKLCAMDPFDFERHVMSFFEASQMLAWVTKKSNDMGVDGFARHPDGVIVVQCKRYSPGKLVGSPAVQQFKGVIEENNALRGYLVTTSDFSEAARQSAGLTDKVILVAMDELVQWHITQPDLKGFMDS